MTELLWGKEPARTRGPKPAITLTAIAEAAIAIADAEGLDAVSMQRIAGDLPVTKMALYRYVPGKTELVAVMSDLAMGGPPDRPDLPWREALRTWAIDLYDGFTRHPWLLQSTIGRRLLGPNELAWMERGVAALTGSGLSGGEQLDSILVITSHVRNIAQQSTTFPGHTTGLTEEDWQRSLGEILATEAGRFPHLTTAMRTSAGSENQGLEFGLARILDGLELLISDRTG
ncbi:TetR/AcrR family transcriptional regulator C-terminal domain-containing protein [Kribbella speibonae]|uniref:TetR family transcriptional regulator n=1 Tax=Kribbella speibonae TaxID=1572660 RepID=A0ABY2A8T8_9ACTN|nr:TetR/AcrR family transcriptional regulator C-terminal domain-containing protein [Kribbella speibonae]TCC25039.1 TetR family transcriptional regulator [Kribbella speibonae]